MLLAIGVAGSSAYDSVVEGKLARGQSLAVGDYRLTYRGLTEREAANATEIRARARRAARDGDRSARIEAGKNSYSARAAGLERGRDPPNSLTGEDLFVIAEQVNEDGTVYFSVFVKPLVNLIWLGGPRLRARLGDHAWPDAREERRLATRYARARAPATRP